MWDVMSREMKWWSLELRTDASWRVVIATLALWQEPRSPKLTSCHSTLQNRLKCSGFCMRVRRKGPDIFETWVVFFNIGRKYQHSLTSKKGIKSCRKEMSYTLLCGSSRKLHAGATRFLMSGTSIGCFKKKRGHFHFKATFAAERFK